MTADIYAGLAMIGFFILMGLLLYALDATLDHKKDEEQDVAKTNEKSTTKISKPVRKKRVNKAKVSTSKGGKK